MYCCRILPPGCSGQEHWRVHQRQNCRELFHNLCIWKGEHGSIHQLPCVLHPTSALYGLGYMPDYVVYHECEYSSTFSTPRDCEADDSQWY